MKKQDINTGLYYDFHIHSALSPCGDDDMTPNNIVNMAMLKGLDAIAVTDHNSVRNLRVIEKLANNRGILLLPGMELETAEEIHMLCYFETVEEAEGFEAAIAPYRPDIKNKVEIFGNQLIFDEEDNIKENVENLLSCALSLPIEKAIGIVRGCGGICVPAHVDKPAYSIYSSLGLIPPEYEFKAVELSKRPSAEEFALKNGLQNRYNILKSSDAHFLWDIAEKVNFLSNCKKYTKKIMNFINNFEI